MNILFKTAWVLCAFFGAVMAQPENKTVCHFDDRGLPEGWKADATHSQGALAKWEVLSVTDAPSLPKVLSITKINDKSGGVFNLFWTPKIRFRDGVLEVKIRADSGQEDQGGGLIWRVRDADNYYITRYNPLEQNFRLYVVKEGSRTMLADSQNIPVKTGDWFVIRVSHRGNGLICCLNGQELLHAEDSTFPEAGGVGFWTKADAASSFDDFSVETMG